MTPEQYRKQFAEDEAVGWNAIDAALAKVYGEQKCRHYAASIPFELGGDEPLSGVSIYDVAATNTAPFHRHVVSYGMSELFYSPESAGAEFSRWGFEFTFRIIPFANDNNADNEPSWAVGLMNNLASYVCTSKKWFEINHFIPANGPIRLETKTEITALAFVLDPALGSINTPNGRVDFLQMVGLTSKEYEWLKSAPDLERTASLLVKMREDNPLLVTDLTRTYSYV